MKKRMWKKYAFFMGAVTATALGAVRVVPLFLKGFVICWYIATAGAIMIGYIEEVRRKLRRKIAEAMK
ncbi:MAG TPA: hypothetical protein ENG66_05525 [Thermococcus sp.]|nr:hypothetical protein [Thermococcus sp.]